MQCFPHIQETNMVHRHSLIELCVKTGEARCTVLHWWRHQHPAIDLLQVCACWGFDYTTTQASNIFNYCIMYLMIHKHNLNRNEVWSFHAHMHIEYQSANTFTLCCSYKVLMEFFFCLSFLYYNWRTKEMMWLCSFGRNSVHYSFCRKLPWQRSSISLLC